MTIGLPIPYVGAVECGATHSSSPPTKNDMTQSESEQQSTIAFVKTSGTIPQQRVNPE